MYDRMHLRQSALLWKFQISTSLLSRMITQSRWLSRIDVKQIASFSRNWLREPAMILFEQTTCLSSRVTTDCYARLRRALLKPGHC